MHIFLDVIKNSLLITGLVMIMMLLIEFINIHTEGESFKQLNKSPFKQVLLAASLGLIPGCVGGFAVVSLYSHRLLSFGALVAMMIASSGDEAFILLALIPKTALILFAILFVLAIVVGLITDKLFKKEMAPFTSEHYQLHKECCSSNINQEGSIFISTIKYNIQNMTKERLYILVGLLLFILSIFVGILEHDHAVEVAEHHHHGAISLLNERWINILFAILGVVTLFFILKSNNHFIKEHLWNHVVTKHIKSIFLWTFGALLLINFAIHYIDLEKIISENIYLVILIAALIGLIPESGPHMIFITAFATGAAPFAVLLTSSIVQDGHTTLPLLAESKRSFIKAKLINMVVGIVVGVAVATLHS